MLLEKENKYGSYKQLNEFISYKREYLSEGKLRTFLHTAHLSF